MRLHCCSTNDLCHLSCSPSTQLTISNSNETVSRLSWTIINNVLLEGTPSATAGRGQAGKRAYASCILRSTTHLALIISHARDDIIKPFRHFKNSNFKNSKIQNSKSIDSTFSQHHSCVGFKSLIYDLIRHLILRHRLRARSIVPIPMPCSPLCEPSSLWLANVFQNDTNQVIG